MREAGLEREGSGKPRRRLSKGGAFWFRCLFFWPGLGPQGIRVTVQAGPPGSTHRVGFTAWLAIVLDSLLQRRLLTGASSQHLLWQENTPREEPHVGPMSPPPQRQAPGHPSLAATVGSDRLGLLSPRS